MIRETSETSLYLKVAGKGRQPGRFKTAMGEWAYKTTKGVVYLL